jgi:ribose transport system permease protein
LADSELKNVKTGNAGLRIINRIFDIQEVNTILPVLILVIVAISFNPGFVTPLNLAAIGRRMSMWGLVAIGEALIIMTGNFDVSIGAIVALACTFFAVAATAWHIPLILAILLTILLCVTLSAISGFVVVKLKISSFLTTIAMLFIARGLARTMTYSRPVPISPAPGSAIFLHFGQAEPLHMSWNFFLFIALIIIFQLILKKTAYGRKIYATGDNPNVARLSGINTDTIKITMFIISGVMIGLAAVFLTAKEAMGNPVWGMGWELQAIAAVAIGGISLIGGAGSMVGLLIGVIMMQVIGNILILLQINLNMQSVVLGVIMILATILDIKRRNRILGKID